MRSVAPSAAAVATLLLLSPAPALAQFQFSLYGGVQEAGRSTVTGTDPDNGGAVNLDVVWEGHSFVMPPYWGVRAVYWQSETLGFGLEFTHDKVYASAGSLAAGNYDILELTDGLNIVTFNVVRQWPGMWDRFTPYLSAGAGVAIPHVEVQAAGGTATIGYQVTGPAVRWTAGVEYALNERWSLFGEYQGTYSWNSMDLDNGGNLETNILTHALNFGVSARF